MENQNNQGRCDTMLENLLTDEDLKRCVDFHGHLCPGLAIGFVASRDGLSRLAEKRANDEEIVTVIGTDACCADAVQVMMGRSDAFVVYVVG
jgi:formylmethanofuran dehydrogenase subunit E